METTKETNQNTTHNPQTAGIPDWVMHLLTGLGTMGAEYMMFIKPLQEKMELQSKLIKEQGERIDELEEFLSHKRKPKRSTLYKNDRDDDGEEENEENEDNENNLFNIKRKPTALSKYTKQSQVKL